MPSTSIGDRASLFQIRRLSMGLKTDLGRLSQELASGRRSGPGAAVSGDFRPVASIERSLTTLAAYRTATTETAQFLEAAQLALDDIQKSVRALSPGLMTAGHSGDGAMLNAAAEDARQKLDAVVSRLNSRAGDRALFAGAATDGRALVDGETLMAALSGAVAGATSAGDVITIVDAWFNTPGGGFESTGYVGSARNIGTVAISENDRVSLDVRADDPALRGTLKGLALAALATDGALSFDNTTQAQLFSEAAERLMTNDSAVTDLRAHVGAVENRVEQASVQNAAETSAYEVARNDLVAVDPYQTATELEAVYGQLETLYTATARIAGLRFTDYMR